MTDLERAADYAARAIPVGFSSPEDNRTCCGVVAQIAVGILALEGGELSEPGRGLSELFQRMNYQLIDMSLSLASWQHKVQVAESELIMFKSKALLDRLSDKG